MEGAFFISDIILERNSMKVFVSWSGETSRGVAELLRKWLPAIIQSTQVFFSPEDIDKGANWDSVIRDELNSSSYGIVCLTPQNVDAPWINFEAGAIANTLDSRVSALMIGINPSDISGPLVRYQATCIEKEDFFKLIKGINASTESPIDNSVLLTSFEAAWPQLYGGLREFEKNTKPRRGAKRDEPNPQELILQTVRSISNKIRSPEKLLPPAYITSILGGFNNLPNVGSAPPYKNASRAIIVSELMHCIVDSLNPMLNRVLFEDSSSNQFTVPREEFLESVNKFMRLLSTINQTELPVDLVKELPHTLQMCREVIAKYGY